jgi:hypothetical protein
LFNYHKIGVKGQAKYHLLIAFALRPCRLNVHGGEAGLTTTRMTPRFLRHNDGTTSFQVVSTTAH